MNIQEIASASAQITELLKPLAEKLGQTAQYTFVLFVKQVYVNAITGLLWWPLGFITAWLAIKKVPKWAKESDEWGNAIYWVDLILIPVAFVTILFPINDLIQALVNPQYQAIKLIIQTITQAE